MSAHPSSLPLSPARPHTHAHDILQLFYMVRTTAKITLSILESFIIALCPVHKRFIEKPLPYIFYLFFFVHFGDIAIILEKRCDRYCLLKLYTYDMVYPLEKREWADLLNSLTPQSSRDVALWGKSPIYLVFDFVMANMLVYTGEQNPLPLSVVGFLIGSGFEDEVLHMGVLYCPAMIVQSQPVIIEFRRI